jgi:hypothetical protein
VRAFDGLGFGANTRVALITRGLAEMMRLGVASARTSDTFMGLAGLGDLALTCTDDQSQPAARRFAAGKLSEQAQREIGQVEGVLASRAVREAARRVGARCRFPNRFTACCTKARAQGRGHRVDAAHGEGRKRLRSRPVAVAGGRANRSCRQASYTATATAFDRFRLRGEAASECGIRSARTRTAPAGRPRLRTEHQHVVRTPGLRRGGQPRVENATSGLSRGSR